MKIFDIHTDILYDCYSHFKKGDSSRFKNYHIPQLRDSKIVGGIWTMYSPDDFDLLSSLAQVLKVIDLKGFEVILGLEGLRNLNDVKEFEKIYDLGFRHAMLTWNEENKFATGIKGPDDRGLTDEGKKILDFMIEKDMIIDLAHLNEKSFFDVLDYTNKNIIVSHSNIKTLCEHKRNLSDAQLYKLKEAGGLLGLTLVGSFIAREKDERTIERFIDHIIYAVEILSIDNVSLGFDFMDYFGDDVGSNIDEIPNATFVNKLLMGLKKRGFTDVDIEKITYSNFINKYRHHIIRGE